MDENEDTKKDNGLPPNEENLHHDHEKFLEELQILEDDLDSEENAQSMGIIEEPVGEQGFGSFSSDVSIKNCPTCGRELINGICPFCTEDIEQEERIEEPREEIERDAFATWRTEMKKKGELNLFGIFSVVVASIYLIYISLPEVAGILTGEFLLEEFVLYLVLLIMGIGALSAGFVMARHVIIYGRLFDTTFEKEIYSRLEPAFAEVGKVKGDLHEIYEKMDRLNLHMNRLETKTYPMNNGGATISGGRNSSLYTTLMIVSLGVVFFILRYPGDYLPYVLSALFLVWWGGITTDFRIWKIGMAWSWAFFAVIVVTIGTMLMHVVYGLGFTIGITGIALAFFSLSYYVWARYYVEGISPGIFSLAGEEE